MSYSTSNPPLAIGGGMSGTGGPNLWLYKSTDDDATVNGADYFSNGDALGMKVGDPVLVIDTTNTVTSLCNVASVTSGGAATTEFGVVS